MNLDQPAPVPNDNRPVWELVIADLSPQAELLDLVIADMIDRDQEGRRKYGVPLQAGNGRDALADAYAEALDLTVYIRQAEAEGVEGTESVFAGAVDVAIKLRRLIDERKPA